MDHMFPEIAMLDKLFSVPIRSCYELLRASDDGFVNLPSHQLGTRYRAYQDKAQLGIDLPIGIQWNPKCIQRTMIVGQEPRRRNVPKGVVSVGHAFDALVGTSPAADHYGHLFHRLLNAGHALYITDYRKLYFRGSPEDKDFHERTDKFHHELIRAEIATMAPTTVITMGAVARDGMEDLLKDQEHIHLPHLSPQIIQQITTVADLLEGWDKLFHVMGMREIAMSLRVHAAEFRVRD